MADYVNMPMEKLLSVFYSLHTRTWWDAAGTWHSMAKNINDTQGSLDLAWSKTPVFKLNEADPEARAFQSFKENVGLSRNSAKEWADFATNVGNRLAATAKVIDDNRHFVDAAARDYQRATKEDEKKVVRLRAALYVWNVANVVRNTFNGVPTPTKPYQAMMGSRPGNEKPGGGDPSAQAGGAGAGPGAGAAGAGVPGAGEKPADAPAAAPKAPEAKDPVEQAGKLIDVVGKGIDLLGKPADVADKYVGLAQHLKDLLGQGSTGTEGLNPDDLFADRPTLAGGTATEPAFTPSGLASPGTSGGAAAGSALPLLGSTAAGIGAGAGAAGAAPSLAGKASSASAAAAQQGMPPMYPPPMGGMGAAGAGAGGRGEIKPGTAPTRTGFGVPTEPTETERWRRHGVQVDQQGCTSKRKRPERTGQDVLDEELWRL